MKIIFRLMLLVSSLQGQCQQGIRQTMFKKYSTKDGLLSNSIRSICYTKNGRWLVATNNGVQQFNGYSFANIYVNPESSSICSYIKEDNQGNLWIFNTDETLVLPKAKLPAIKIIAVKENKSFSLDNQLTPIIEQGNYMWCWGKNGIYGIDNNNFIASVFLPVDIGKTGAMFKPCISINEDGSAWISGHISSESFLIRFKPNEKIEMNKYPNCINGLIKGCITLPHNELLIVGTKMTSICKNADVAHPIKIITTQNLPGSYLRSFTYEKLQVYDRGNILFAGDSCIYMYDVNTKNISPYIPSNLSAIKLSRQLIYTVKEDKNGNIWIGLDASDASIMYYRQQQRFNFLQPPKKYNSPTYSLAVRKDEYTYMAGFHNGINIFDDKGIWVKYIKLPGTEEGTNLSIRPMAFIDDENLIMKSVYGKLLVLNTTTNIVTDLSTQMFPFLKNTNLAFEAAMIQHGTNELLFSHGKYLFQITKQKDQFKLNLIDSVNINLHINAIVFNEKNNLLVGTDAGCYAKKNDAWLLIKGTENYYVKCLTKSTNGNIWIATTKGIFIYNESGCVKTYSSQNGLLNDFVYSVLFEKNGNAWYSSNRGLGCIQTNGEIYNFTDADGLQADEFDTDSYGISTKGKLYFGGVNGITSFYPFVNKSSTSITINQININEKPIIDSLTNISNGLQLYHYENALSFDFSLGPFSEIEKNNYQIKMQGLDTGWINLGNEHTARYNLLPNNYIFQIRGRSNTNEWCTPLNLPIHIKPAWWQTLFFKIGIIIFSILLIAYTIWYLLNLKNKKTLQKLLVEQKILKERQRISSELHDNVGSRLTNIIVQLDYLEFVQKQKPEQLLAKLDVVQQKSREAMVQLRESIWVLNEGTITLKIFSQKLLQYSMDIFTEESGTDFSLQNNGDMEINITAYQAVHLLRIFQEIFQNIQKHASAIQVKANIVVDVHKINFSVQDNGVGFLQTSIPTGNGFFNINNRIKELGGSVIINSKKGEGTFVQFVITQANV